MFFSLSFPYQIYGILSSNDTLSLMRHSLPYLLGDIRHKGMEQPQGLFKYIKETLFDRKSVGDFIIQD